MLRICTPPLSFWGMCLYAFGMMLGAFDITFFDSLGEFRLLGQGLFIAYMVFQMILLLNLLIALMGDSYEKVQEKAKVEALRERAGLLVEIELVAGKRYLKRNNYCPRWLHALVPKETLQAGETRRNREWAGITGTIRQDLESQLSVVRNQIRDEMEKNAEALTERISGNVAAAMREIGREVSNAVKHTQITELQDSKQVLRNMSRRHSSVPWPRPAAQDSGG
uniref:Polycystin cation channel PKD1/PKD2 domain-containing protein n=1 Tax=Tetraselmis sp. GSL018 TaxID=582737 RepID=A0A061RUB1_9CHLO